jgi:hypothetical protein
VEQFPKIYSDHVKVGRNYFDELFNREYPILDESYMQAVAFLGGKMFD